MELIITKSDYYRGTLTHKQLMNIPADKFMLVRIANKSIAIRHHGELDGLTVRTVNIETKHKVQLWKQSMEMQIRGRCNQFKKETRRYMVQSIDENQLNRYRFEVYEIVR